MPSELEKASSSSSAETERAAGRAVSPSSSLPGWALPLQLEADGTAPRTRRDPVVDTARLILEIVPGERPCLPNLGCRVHLGPLPVSLAERQLAAALLEESLERWAPWLGVERVEIAGVEGRSLDVELRAAGRRYRFSIAHRGPGPSAALEPAPVDAEGALPELVEEEGATGGGPAEAPPRESEGEERWR